MLRVNLRSGTRFARRFCGWAEAQPFHPLRCARGLTLGPLALRLSGETFHTAKQASPAKSGGEPPHSTRGLM